MITKRPLASKTFIANSSNCGKKQMEKTAILTGEEFMKRLVSLTNEDIEDWIIALRAAETMAKRWREDVAILTDFRVVKLKENDEPPLEIIRYDV